MNLKRYAPQVFSTTATKVDDLDYQYAGNRLTKIIENAMNDTGYEGGNNTIDYDLNGSMTNMKDKGISGIIYNHLSLPDAFGITQADPFGGSPLNFILDYLYRADGTKVRKTYSSGGTRGNPTITKNMTDYLDGFQYGYSEVTQCLWCRTSVAYEQQAFKDPVLPGTPTPSWLLDFVHTAEGFYSFTENRYIYQYVDHLGNARVSYAKDSQGNLQITGQNNYYAFGMNHIAGKKSLLGGYQNYKYNGKEIQESGMYDYGARFYLPDVGRWVVVDPLAEQMRRHSPYNYAFNNPIRFIDPDGMAPLTDFKLLKNGNVERIDKNDGSEKRKDDRLYTTDYNGNVTTDDPLVINKEKNTDNSLISDLEVHHKMGDTQATKDVSYAETSSGENAANLFEFVSNNSDVEWAVSGHENYSKYVVATSHYLNTSNIEKVSPAGIFTSKTTEFLMHNHPFTQGASEPDKKIVGGDKYINYVYFSGRPGMRQNQGDVYRFNAKKNVREGKFLNKLRDLSVFKNKK